MYSLPSVEDGSVVIALDPVTLPRGYALDGRRPPFGSQLGALLRTPLGGGTLLRQNFALRRTGGARSDDAKRRRTPGRRTASPRPCARRNSMR
jgi:hypothetical protein